MIRFFKIWKGEVARNKEERESGGYRAYWLGRWLMIVRELVLEDFGREINCKVIKG